MITFYRRDVRNAAVPSGRSRRVAGWALAVVLTLGLALSWTTPAGAESDDWLVVQTVSFRVQNINRSAVACNVDGKTYEVRGQIVGPSSALRPSATQRAITLYLHGLGGGQVIWRF